MTEALPAIQGKWWRAESYELSDGYIQPVPGSSIHEYDPMETYWQSTPERSPKGQKVNAPYMELFDLSNSCRWGLGPSGHVLTKESEELLLGWVNKYGLLGILPHQTIEILGQYTTKDKNKKSTSTQTELFWLRDTEDPARPSPDVGRLGYGQPDSLEALVLVQDLHTATVKTTSWESVAAPYFIRPLEQLNHALRYPFPGEPGFWGVYREPVESFLQAAALLYAAFKELGVMQQPEDPDTDLPLAEQGIHEWSGPASLNHFLSAVRPSLVPPKDTGKYQGYWRSASLLGTLAFQIYWDLTYGRNYRICVCPYCSKAFSSRSLRAEYCSNSCRLKAHRGRQNEGVKEKKKRKAKG